MRTSSRISWASTSLVLVLAACGAEQTPSSDETSVATQTSAAVTPETSVPEPEAPVQGGGPIEEGSMAPTVAPEPAPEGTDAIATSIRARHNEDLPTPEELAALPDAAASLLWLERNATHMFERTRALTLMRYAPSEAVLARLNAVAADETEAEVARRAAQESLDALPQ